MGGKKRSALATIRAALKEQGYPDDLQLRPGQLRENGREYGISGMVNGRVVRVARLLYDETTNEVVRIDDQRPHCPNSTLCGIHTNPEIAKKQAMIPSIMEHVTAGLGSDIVRWQLGQHPDWTMDVFAHLIVRDRTGMIHRVACVMVADRKEKSAVQQQLGLLFNHTSVIIWTTKSRPAHLGGAIISDIRRWQKRNWPH